MSDIDNTLFDWLSMWAAGFSRLLADLVASTGLTEEEVKTAIRRAHTKLGSSEHDRVVDHIVESDQRFLHVDRESVTEAYVREQRSATQLFPGVRETLIKLRSDGVLVVGLTESLRPFAEARAYRLGLDGLIGCFFCAPERSESNDEPRCERLRQTEVFEFDLNLKKPDPRLLKAVAERLAVTTNDIVYVGDSLFKDIMMANAGGVTVCWAKYGSATSTANYRLLQQVSHWTDAEIQRELSLGAQPSPDHVLASGFSEVLAIV